MSHLCWQWLYGRQLGSVSWAVCPSFCWRWWPQWQADKTSLQTVSVPWHLPFSSWCINLDGNWKRRHTIRFTSPLTSAADRGMGQQWQWCLKLPQQGCSGFVCEDTEALLFPGVFPSLLLCFGAAPSAPVCCSHLSCIHRDADSCNRCGDN